MRPKLRSILTATVPAVAVALVMSLALPGSALLGTLQGMNEHLPVHGYVVVSVVREGQEIYHHEDHNLITTVGLDFIREQVGQTSGSGAIDSNGANYIGLTTNSNAASATDTCLATTQGGTTSAEITTNGLARAQGTYAEVSTDQFTIAKTFTASGTHTSVQKTGLFTAAATADTCTGGNDGIMVAENTFTAVTLASGDELTVTWTITIA